MAMRATGRRCQLGYQEIEKGLPHCWQAWLRRQCSAQVLQWIPRCPPGSNGEAEDLPAHLQGALGEDDGAAPLDLADRLQQLGRLDRSNRLLTNGGEDVALKPAPDPRGTARHQSWPTCIEPFSCHHLKAVLGCQLRPPLLGFFSSLGSISLASSSFALSRRLRASFRLTTGKRRGRASSACQ